MLTTDEAATLDEAVLSAVLAGSRTEAQIAEAVGISLDDLLPAVLERAAASAAAPTSADLRAWLDLDAALGRLVCADLLCMQVVDGAWHYKPTRKARLLHAAGASA